MADFDLAIIGGGINGAGIARDAAGRGLKVVLIEQNDLASGTSSVSSKLIHGGLRYLEQGALRLVRASLREREVLLRIAPHLVEPLRFVLPLDADRRSPLLVSARPVRSMTGSADARSCRARRALDLVSDEAGLPLRTAFHRGFEYSDCLGDDARLVITQCASTPPSVARSCARAPAAFAPSAPASGGSSSTPTASAT